MSWGSQFQCGIPGMTQDNSQCLNSCTIVVAEYKSKTFVSTFATKQITAIPLVETEIVLLCILDSISFDCVPFSKELLCGFCAGFPEGASIRRGGCIQITNR